jgi:Domain of unknown function (DUF4404)
MTNNDLSKILESLHTELIQNRELDEQAVRSLKALASDIQSALERSGYNQSSNLSSPLGANEKSSDAENNDPAHLTLADRMRSLIDDFEVQHPQLTNILSTIAERLSDMGI